MPDTVKHAVYNFKVYLCPYYFKSQSVKLRLRSVFVSIKLNISPNTNLEFKNIIPLYFI